jgi:hypothetical protein
MILGAVDIHGAFILLWQPILRLTVPSPYTKLVQMCSSLEGEWI